MSLTVSPERRYTFPERLLQDAAHAKAYWETPEWQAARQARTSAFADLVRGIRATGTGPGDTVSVESETFLRPLREALDTAEENLRRITRRLMAEHHSREVTR